MKLKKYRVRYRYGLIGLLAPYEGLTNVKATSKKQAKINVTHRFPLRRNFCGFQVTEVK